MTRRGLGRGLDALISSTGPDSEPPVGSSGMLEVAVDEIQVNPYQPRHDIEDVDLEELAASIRAHGLIQPLILTPGPGDRLTIIAGERRWRAARLAGLDRVPAIVREASEQQMLALAIVENVQRSDLNPIDAAEGYRRLMDEFGLTQAAVAELIGKSRAAVANTVRLLGLPKDLRDWVAVGKLSEGHGRALLAVEDAEERRALAETAVREGWPVRRLEEAARRMVGSASERDAPRRDAPSGAATAEIDPDTAAAIRALEEALGTRVEIRRRGDGGQVIVHFYSEEELAALFDRLVADG